MIITPDKFNTHSLFLSSHGDDICAILAAAIVGADAGNALKKHVIRHDDSLIIDNNVYSLNNYRHIFVIGVGKACSPMVEAINHFLDDAITSCILITKEEHTGDLIHFSNLQVIEAGHPIPDQRNVDAGKQLITFIDQITPEDLVIVLLSGGGSALLTYPAPGILLNDIQETTYLLLKSGVSIVEVNTIRRHLDLFKGGGLAKLLYPATTINLILSDVLGGNLEAIASGPTVADSTTFHDAWSILDKYQLIGKVPSNISAYIFAGCNGKIIENPKSGDPVFDRVRNVIIGDIHEAMNSAISLARDLGYSIELVTDSLQGEASVEGKRLARDLRMFINEAPHEAFPLCLLYGGESTVTIKGQGLGGRSQELALGAVNELSSIADVILVSLATDGGDGPTDAAGAVVTNETYARSLAMGLDPEEFLIRNDSYHYFEALGDLIKTGPTLTNVNDLVFMFAF